MTKYGRRNVAECTSGIGNWMSIMGFVSYFAIPINVVILLVVRFPSVQIGATQDLDTLLITEKSVLTQYLVEKDDVFWTRANIIIFAIAVEHCVIALKVLMALIIPDVPHKVIQDEFRRVKISAQVTKELLEIKFKGGHESFTDMTERLQREAADIMEKAMAEDVAADQAAEAEGVVETKEQKKAKKKAKKAKEAAVFQQMEDAKKAAMSTNIKKNQKKTNEKKKRKKDEKKKGKDKKKYESSGTDSDEKEARKERKEQRE